MSSVHPGRSDGSRAGILAASPCGRWLALSGELVDLRTMTGRPFDVADAALFHGDRGAFVLADSERVWRVALP
ncbi:MAG: hypothetical protein IPG50_38205 [Myxococcales bacterium]|nr:hypothetical protein [Myxococcales bacterium]